MDLRLKRRNALPKEKTMRFCRFGDNRSESWTTRAVTRSRTSAPHRRSCQAAAKRLLPRAKKASLARVKLVAVGPWMVTADEFGSPDAVDIELSVNGEGIGRMQVEVRDA